MNNYCLRIPSNQKCRENWGHLIRDLCYYIVYHFDFTKEEFDLYILHQGRNFAPGFKEFVLRAFGSRVQFVDNEAAVPKNAITSSTDWRREVRKLPDHNFPERILNLYANWPDFSVNKFRDLCLKNFKIDTEIKNKILLVPRRAESKRLLYDYKKIANEIQSTFKNYELKVWYNEDHTPEEQMQAWAESKIIICLCGTDMVNATWCHNYAQRIIEIISPNHYSGHAPQFYCQNIISAALYGFRCPEAKQAKSSYKIASSRSPRDWHFIYAKKESALGEVYLNEKDREDMLGLVREII